MEELLHPALERYILIINIMDIQKAYRTQETYDQKLRDVKDLMGANSKRIEELQFILHKSRKQNSIIDTIQTQINQIVGLNLYLYLYRICIKN